MPRKRRLLKKELKRVERHIWEMEVMLGLGKGTINPWGRDQRAMLMKLIDQHDSRMLEKEAEKFGIEIPVRPDWFSTELIAYDPDNLDDVAQPEPIVGRWLNETGRTMISKQVRDARFAYWKGWAELLVPILALIVAALALFKEIIVEVLKK
jgi:hypothetical protein